ncbi:MAG: DUF3226 domain-containing protein [Candidatus Baldrarchaeia archaeon]
MPIVQLKPHENAFYALARKIVKELEVIVLCEGRTDAEVLKAIIKKLELPDINMGVTDCEGVPAIREITSYIATLSQISKKIKVIGVIIDADEYDYEQRARSVMNSLKSSGVPVKELNAVDENLFDIKNGKFPILILVSGIRDLPLKAIL